MSVIHKASASKYIYTKMTYFLWWVLEVTDGFMAVNSLNTIQLSMSFVSVSESDTEFKL